MSWLWFGAGVVVGVGLSAIIALRVLNAIGDEFFKRRW